MDEKTHWQECADTVLEVVLSANAEAVDKWREDSIMCETLARIMEPEMSKARAAAEKQGMEQGIAQGMVQGIALAKNVLKLQAQGLLPPEIAEKVGITESEVLHILE
jgi:hypothetical protein